MTTAQLATTQLTRTRQLPEIPPAGSPPPLHAARRRRELDTHGLSGRLGARMTRAGSAMLRVDEVEALARAVAGGYFGAAEHSLERFVEQAMDSGGSVVLIGILTDAAQPVVARQRAFGLLAGVVVAGTRHRGGAGAPG